MAYPPNGAGAFEGSTISLRPTPPTFETPNPIATWMDPYWRKPAKKLFARADYEVSQASKLMKKDKDMPLEEVETLSYNIDQVNNLSNLYVAAVREKKKQGAREYVGRLDKGINVLNASRTSSRQLADKRAKVKEGFSLISGNRRADILLTAPKRQVTRCERRVRLDVLRKCTDWLKEGHHTRRIHWLRGESRSGKSTVLRWITDQLLSYDKDNANWVVAIAFDTNFNRLDLFVDHFLPTILAQLADRFRALKEALSSLCTNIDPSTYFEETHYVQQVQTLFVSSISRVLSMENSKPVLIVLDGLDECDDATLSCLFLFIECVLYSKVPAYFIIASSDSYRIRQHIDAPPLAPLVDINEVEDYFQARAKAASWTPSEPSSDSQRDQTGDDQ
ncbi:hypothetical protein FA13DRAFT_1747515 [Coprinellus micaceus]|uniref:Nephrocystin 3-like N-terminal domain-containing protein n=1 Tax=Coprinellus micaceus TaxID=71717 RepID=A0A4Y7S3E7_COPMI|nr:hypothetical protein FA13DRAFT_1747515 [Coprinellus micaceus]